MVAPVPNDVDTQEILDLAFVLYLDMPFQLSVERLGDFLHFANHFYVVDIDCDHQISSKIDAGI